MPGVSYPSRSNGLPVVTAPAEIDVITAQKLRMVLLQAAANGHAIIVVDLTGTRFCDSSELDVLDAAHRRALDEGGELRLVLPPSGSVVRVLATTGLNRCIPCFTGLDEALAAPRPNGTSPNTALTDPTVEELDGSQTATLRRAITFIDENAHTSITVADIAAAAHVTTRAIQLIFRRHLDTTPAEYLRRVRLNHAHRDLLAADPVHESVSAVAYRWGFSSQSRFAALYRQAYGIPPSKTLQRD